MQKSKKGSWTVISLITIVFCILLGIAHGFGWTGSAISMFWAGLSYCLTSDVLNTIVMTIIVFCGTRFCWFLFTCR